MFLVKEPGGGARAAAAARAVPDADTLDRLSYRLHAVGFPLWTFAALIAGPIWAEYAWGSYWNWDPKEVWAFITWVVYAAYLHARATAGWKGKAGRDHRAHRFRDAAVQLRRHQLLLRRRQPALLRRLLSRPRWCARSRETALRYAPDGAGRWASIVGCRRRLEPGRAARSRQAASAGRRRRAPRRPTGSSAPRPRSRTNRSTAPTGPTDAADRQHRHASRRPSRSRRWTAPSRAGSRRVGPAGPRGTRRVSRSSRARIPRSARRSGGPRRRAPRRRSVGGHEPRARPRGSGPQHRQRTVRSTSHTISRTEGVGDGDPLNGPRL